MSVVRPGSLAALAISVFHREGRSIDPDHDARGIRLDGCGHRIELSALGHSEAPGGWVMDQVFSASSAENCRSRARLVPLAAREYVKKYGTLGKASVSENAIPPPDESDCFAALAVGVFR